MFSLSISRRRVLYLHDKLSGFFKNASESLLLTNLLNLKILVDIGVNQSLTPLA